MNATIKNNRDSNKRKSSVKIIFDLTRDSLEVQRVQKNTLESKANTLIAFAAGIFALLMGSKNIIVTLPRFQQFLVLFSVFCLSSSVILSTVVGWVRRYRTDPDPDHLAEYYIDASEDVTRKQIIVNWLGAWKSNALLIERNAFILRLAFFSQTIGFIALGLALFLSIL